MIFFQKYFSINSFYALFYSKYYEKVFLFFLLLLSLNGQTQNDSIQPISTDYLHGFRQFTIKEGLASDDVRRVLSDQKGFIWIATEMGLNRFDGRTFMHFSAEEHGLRANNIHDIIADDHNRLWIQSEKNNRFYTDLLDLATLAVTPFEALPKNISTPDFDLQKNSEELIQEGQTAKILKQDPVSGRYILITGKEVSILDAKQNIIGGPGANIYTQLPGVVFHQPYFDPQGNIWIPTIKHGLVYLHIKEKIFQTASPSAVDNPIYPKKLTLNQPLLAIDKHIWLANKALHSYNTQLKQAYKWELDAPLKMIKAHASTGNELCLVVKNPTSATLNLYRLDATKKNWTSYALSNIFDLNVSISALYQDKKGLIWIGTDKGAIIRVNTNSSAIESLPPAALTLFKGSPIHQFEATKEGIWISTSKGLFLYEDSKGIIQHYNHTAKSPIKISPKVNNLFALPNGQLWMTSTGYGLGKLDPINNTFQQFTKKDGFRNDITHLVIKDKKDIIWVTNRNGLNQLNILNGKIRSIQLADQTYNNVYNDAARITADGQLVFSSTTSVLAFQPEDLLGNYNSRVVVSGLNHLDAETRRFRNQLPELLATQQITVQPHQTFLSVDFALLDFYQPLYHQYEYQIEGLYDNWISTRENSLQLGGLPYGDYRFKVRIANEYGQRANEEINLPLVILKPFYLKTWFILFAILTGIALIYGLLQWRTSRLRKSSAILKAAVSQQTQQLEADKLLIENQAEELRHLDQLKSRFFANVSHELRTPLTLLLSPIQTVLKSDDLTVKNDSLLRLAQQNGQRLLQLTNEILDLNKLEAGKLALQLSNVVLFNFLKRIIAAFQSHAENSKIELVFQYELDKYLQVKLDKKKTETILINLLSNALKFTPSKGKVIVIAKDYQKYLQVSVQDTGRGIHPDDLPHIFNRFFQTKQANRQAEGGTGIGLALSQELTKLMNGSLQVTSKINHGATFTLALPHIEVMAKISDEAARLVLENQLNQNEQAAKVSDTLKVSPTLVQDLNNQPKNQTILLVEDNHDLRKYIQSLLLPHYQVQTAENGQVALDYLATNPKPNLIISDIMMPLMDGYQLLETLKNAEQYRLLPVIMLTALAGANDKLKALRIGVDDYMLKPFSEEELLARVHNLIKHATLREEFLQAETIPSPTAVNTSATEKTSVSIEVSPTDQAWLTQLEHITLEKLGNFNLSVEQLASEMAQSRWQFNRHLKGLTGLTARQYLLETRLNQARTLLEQGNHTSVKAVVYTVGIKDLQHFSRQFKDRFGKSPSAYLVN